MCLYVALDEAPRYAEAGPSPSFMCGENVGSTIRPEAWEWWGKLGGSCEKEFKGLVPMYAPKSILDV